MENKHEVIEISEGDSFNTIITPSCTCGWKGKGEPVYEDWYPKNLANQIKKHLDEVNGKKIQA